MSLMFALHCVMCKRVMSEEMTSFDVALAQLVSGHSVEMSRSLLLSLLICSRPPQWFYVKLDRQRSFGPLAVDSQESKQDMNSFF